jgi:diguanylate cyclase (GGDEF)-like protein
VVETAVVNRAPVGLAVMADAIGTGAPVPVGLDTAEIGRARVEALIGRAGAPEQGSAPPVHERRGTNSGGPASPSPAAGQLVADRIAARVRSVYGLQRTLAAPLTTDNGVVGAIVLSHRTEDRWSPTSQRLLAGAAEEASAALARAYSHRDAEARASTDALTGLPNRRYFDEFCGLLARRRRADDAVGVLMIDIDHFKNLNDTFGHATGDEVLRAVAGAIVAAVREDDVPARFGGEEFVVLLRNPGMDVAVDVGERVRTAVAGLDLGRLAVPEITVSVGVAVSRHADQPIDDLVERADQALYRAKRAGRNRVIPA